jgi:hypothetical protein
VPAGPGAPKLLGRRLRLTRSIEFRPDDFLGSFTSAIRKE